MSRMLLAVAAGLAVAGLVDPCLAQDVAQPAADAATTAAAAAPAVAPTPDKGDTTWMLVSTILVILMTVPGLALFYGGLVRAKNVLSILMQVFAGFSLIAILWSIYGYSVAFTEGNAFFGGFSKLFLAGVTDTSLGATFSRGVYIPEIVFVIFQLTFAGITPALIVGAFAERLKFGPVMLFLVLWFTFSYLPMAHMVWYWNGPDAYIGLAGEALDTANAAAGFLWQKGALDFAGGTVVHINAGVAGLVIAIMSGRRLGYPTEAMPPHNLPMTLIGGCLLWVGWFGFNAGSNLESNYYTGLAVLNTILATAAAAWGWALAEWIHRGKPSLLGAVSGAVAGLVAVTPAAGFAGPMGAIVLGAVASVVCFLAVSWLKNMFRYDDSLDVFGIHGVGGIVGAIGTAIVVSPALGGTGYVTDWTAAAGPAFGYDFSAQIVAQLWGVGLSIVWTTVVSVVAFKIVDLVFRARVSDQEEREGLDLVSHGERAYN